MNNLSLLDAAYMDAAESAITEAEIKNFIDSSFSGGSGPNQETRNHRQQEKTQSKAHAFAYKFKLLKSSGDFGQVNYNKDVHFDFHPNSSHQPDKCRQEPAKDIKAIQRKSAAMIYVQRERGLTETKNFRNH